MNDESPQKTDIELPQVPGRVRARLQAGLVIPAHPLAVDSNRQLDEPYQRALTRYYHAAGAGGIAVGVHTTQFAIRKPEYGLYKPVLELAAETIAQCDLEARTQTVRIAGVCGPLKAAVDEAIVAREFGYHAALLSLGAFTDAAEAPLLTHCRIIAREIPLMGFYLQPLAGGRILSPSFWRQFAAIPNVVAIKIAPFNRYQTLDVIRAVAEVGRASDIALYTGNDDHIVLDLLTEYSIPVADGEVRLRMSGGLLGQWACGTRQAVWLLGDCHRLSHMGSIPGPTLTLAEQLTDCNAAIFDAANGFAGCIPGIHEVLRRQGLMRGNWCLNPDEKLSQGQAEAIDRVLRCYPQLHDTEFIEQNREKWLKD